MARSEVKGKAQYKEFRKDGWPLCPNCEQDELWSRLSWTGKGKKPPIEKFIENGLQCYWCKWQSVEMRF